MDDDRAREEALARDRSFIVRAPAGSGKTELLIQRFLSLLATVDAPEQILALTFTRKAAAEMRNRIMEQLHAAKTELPPEAPAHRQLTWRLARQVLAQDARQQWCLCDSPERLRLITIDALCADIVRQLPLASGLAHCRVTDQASELYEVAVQELFADLDEASPWQAALVTLLSHCDNRLDHLSTLCRQLLAQREQWLALMMAAQDDPQRLKTLLEANFRHVSHSAIAAVDRLIEASQKRVLLEHLRMAADLAVKHRERWQCFVDLEVWPEASVDQQDFWHAVACSLLTENLQLRKRLDSNGGFPAPSKAPDKATQAIWRQHKEGMQALLEVFREQEALLPALQNCVLMPPATFDADEWPLCCAIFSLLPALLSYWQLVCDQQQQIDFAEVALRARRALSGVDQTADLALQLDYQVRHYLVDEFQDTSLAQFELLMQLTAGWQQGDGRTIFLVGDPLQSIYRFRQAEVSLFWRVWQQGLPSVVVTPLCLSRNFRSQVALVDWFNTHFPPLFPTAANWQVGAVPYTSVSSGHAAPAMEGPAVFEHTVSSTVVDDEALQIVALLQQELAETTPRSIALLVKARSHLAAILPLLQYHNIPYRAVELASLANQAVIQDVFSLLCAVLRRDDRLAWAALLRAPWGGALHLVDWQQLVGDASTSFIWPWQERTAILSDEGIARVARITPYVEAALSNLHRVPPSRWLVQLWHDLGAATYWHSAPATQALAKFWILLQREEQAGDVLNLSRFERLLATTYLEETPAARLEIMTIHKAKGLEFDVVILPGLGRRAAVDDTPLFLFDSISDGCDAARWLLAPMKATHQQHEPRYDFLRNLQKQKNQHEQQRLFYVACTRARQRLHLLTLNSG